MILRVLGTRQDLLLAGFISFGQKTKHLLTGDEVRSDIFLMWDPSDLAYCYSILILDHIVNVS